MKLLVLEVISGPLDGTTLSLDSETQWSKVGEGPLSFPWDEEMGTPQAVFLPEDDHWLLQCHQSPHGTYRINTGDRLTSGNLTLAEGDVLKASHTWLIVRKIREPV